MEQKMAKHEFTPLSQILFCYPHFSRHLMARFYQYINRNMDRGHSFPGFYLNNGCFFLLFLSFFFLITDDDRQVVFVSWNFDSKIELIFINFCSIFSALQRNYHVFVKKTLPGRNHTAFSFPSKELSILLLTLMSVHAENNFIFCKIG